MKVRCEEPRKQLGAKIQASGSLTAGPGWCGKAQNGEKESSEGDTPRDSLLDCPEPDLAAGTPNTVEQVRKASGEGKVRFCFSSSGQH